RLCAGTGRGADQGLLSRGFQHGDLRHHGAGPAGQAGRPLREGCLNMADEALGQTSAGHGARLRWLLVALAVAALLVAPAFIYTIFLMKILCFALFACAFNLLLGYTGLLSFGHAALFGGAAYFTAHAAKVWGWPPEAAILLGVAGAAAMG